ncbi:MAG: YfcE family phosphodiesterase [Candidatus Odinarchaeia archaeon]
MQVLSKILVVGDMHIPVRAKAIPRPILSFLKGKMFDLVICTGDLVKESILDVLSNFGPVKTVRGNCDTINAPSYLVVNVKGLWKIGTLHGHQVYPRGNLNKLKEIAEKMKVDILVYGHTHEATVDKVGKIILISPGSLTGVPSGGKVSSIPSFIILNLYSDSKEIVVFNLLNEKIKETKYLL